MVVSHKKTVRLLWRTVGSLAFLVSPCLAQTYLYDRATFATGETPVAAVAMDFNGDGTLDLAVVNQAGNSVSVLLGKPDATFAAKVDYAVGDSPSAIVGADFNADGKADLAVANSGLNTVSILLGNGDGTFAGHVDYSAANNPPVGMVAGDFNGDGNVDLAVANGNDNTFFSILLGNGDGTFTGSVAITLAQGYTPVAIAGGDFNRDGNIDLLISNRPIDSQILPTVSVFLSKGNGSFTRVDTAVRGYGALAVGDFNRDGKADAVVAIGNGMLFLNGHGDGTFNPLIPVTIDPRRESFGAAAFLAADFNHDGKLDLVAGNEFESALLLGNGDGTFVHGPYLGNILGYALLAADINRDGVPDVVFGFPSNPSRPETWEVRVLLGTGDGTFGGTPDYNLLPVSNSGLVPLNGIHSGPAIAGDFDGNGKPDVTVFEYNEGSAVIAVLPGNGDGSFRGPVSTPTTTSQYCGYALAVGDFNGDGKMDLACSSSAGPYIYLGNGDETFQPPLDVPTPPHPIAQSLAVGDFNDDRKEDLAIVASDSAGTHEAVQILLGQGNGVFTAGASIPLDSAALFAQGIYWAGAVFLTAADFNHDGRIDVAAAQGQTVAVLLGTGDGIFQNPAFYECGHYSIEAIDEDDFNGDGNPDLLVSTYDGVSVFLGNGDGTFQTHLDTRFAGGPGSRLAAGNFTGHGSVDLAYADCILAGNGDGTFQLPRCLGFTPAAVAAADFNSDGSTDLALDTQFNAQVPFVNVLLSAPQIALYPSPLSFGSQEVGVSSTARDLSVSNIGNAPINISSIVTGGDFSQTNNCGAAIPPQAECVISVTFTPAAAGGRTGNIALTDNLRSTPQVIAVDGLGVAPSVSLLPAALTFGAQSVGTTSPAKMVTLANTGNLPLIVYSIVADGDFAETNNCGTGVAAGLSCTIRVTFTPTADGGRSGHLTVSDNAPDSPQGVALAGSGPDFVLAPSSGSPSTASVSPGQSATYTLTLQGEAGMSQTVTFTCTGAPPEARCAVSPSSLTAGSSAIMITVTVTTTASSVSAPRSRPVPLVAPLHFELLSLVTLALALAAIGWATRGRYEARAIRCRYAIILLEALLLLTLTLLACGGGGGGGGSARNPGTPSGSYALTVTGAAGSGSSALSHSVTLTLNVS